MKEVERSVLTVAAKNLVKNPSFAEMFPPSKEKSRLLNALQNHIYNDGPLREVETALAWALGFHVIRD